MFPSCRDLHKVLWMRMSDRLDLLKTWLNPHLVVPWWKANRSRKVSLLLCCLATVLPLPPALCCLLSHCEWWYFAAFYVLGDENLPCFPIPRLPSPTDTLLSKCQAHTHTYTHTRSTPQECFQPAATQWCKLGGWICHQLKKGLQQAASAFLGCIPVLWDLNFCTQCQDSQTAGVCDLWRSSVCFLVNYMLVACHWRFWALLTWSAVNCMHAKLISNKKAFLAE